MLGRGPPSSTNNNLDTVISFSPLHILKELYAIWELLDLLDVSLTLPSHTQEVMEVNQTFKQEHDFHLKAWWT